MKFEPKQPARKFWVGHDNSICIRDVGDFHLSANEQVTFVTERRARFDFARKDWGYYATPSINGRLLNEGFKTALVGNQQGRIYVMVVEVAELEKFKHYCETEKQTIRCWLDETAVRDK